MRKVPSRGHFERKLLRNRVIFEPILPDFIKKWRFFAFFLKLSKVIGHLFCNFAPDLADGDFLSRIVRACSSPRKPDPSAKSHEVTKKIGQARRRVRPTSVQRRQRDTFAGCSSVVGSWRLPIASCVKNFVRFRSGLMLFNPDSSQANEDTFLEVWGYFFFKKVCNTAHFLAQFAWKVPIFLHMWKNFCHFARFFVSTIFDHRENISLERTLTC